MSADTPGEQTTLADVAASRDRNARTRAAAQGAVYGRSDDAGDHDADDPGAARNACAHCERGVDATTARVLGDDHGVVPVCRECAAPTNGHEFASTAKAVRAFVTSSTTVVLKEEDR